METEIVLKFEEIEGEYSGYLITTNKRTISFLIENFQSCCEIWDIMLVKQNTLEVHSTLYVLENNHTNNHENFKFTVSENETENESENESEKSQTVIHSTFNDISNELIGKTIKNVEWNLQKPLYLPFQTKYKEICNDASINIIFENTKLQIIAYNEHNGYYPKKIKVNLGEKEDVQEL